jgi:Domain of unknown function (DUF4417)
MSTLPPTSANARFEPALGCQDCFARNECGGLHTPGAIDCFCHCCNKPERCTYLCPRSKNFLAVWRDTGGITITTPFLRQDHTTLPAYVPVIQHGNKRTTPLTVPWAALTTFDVTRRDKRHKDMLRDPGELRAKFQLEPSTALLLSSVAPDNELEMYWKLRHHRHLAEGIKAINPAHVIAPNFSLFRDVPRFDNLANIKRSITCAEELSKAGLSVIPYVAGITATDWERWADFLKEQEDITMVCKEFQTGPSKKTVGEWHIHRLQEFQQRLGRELHLVAVGGRRHRQNLRAFGSLTIIDSVPFMRTMHRRQLCTNGWQDAPTPHGAPLDDLLAHNITAYTARINQSRPSVPRHGPRTATTIDPNQLVLWPDYQPHLSAGA